MGGIYPIFTWDEKKKNNKKGGEGGGKGREGGVGINKNKAGNK